MKKLSCLLTVAALAVVLGGCGAGSNPSAPASILDSAPPQAPTGLAQDLNISNVRVLEWTANSEPDLAGYQIYQYSPDPSRDNAYVLVATVSAGTTEWTLPVTDAPESAWPLAPSPPQTRPRAQKPAPGSGRWARGRR